MRKLILLTLFLGAVVFSATAQEIKFFDGTLKEAFKEAKKQKKLIFVDCYATWCGPCKKMAAEVFTNAEVANYYNEKFVCVKLDIQAPENKDFVIKHKISSIPDLKFLDASGKVIDQTLGAMSSQDFLHLGQVVCGERPSFTQLYEQSKKEPQNLELKQIVLLDARSFVNRAPEEDRKKWISRINAMYSDYIEVKPLSECVNEKDFSIFAMYNNPVKKDNAIFKFLCDNYLKYKAVFGSAAPAHYIIPTHSNMMTEMAKNGDLDYLKELDRMKGDMKDVYAEISHPKLDPYVVQKYQLDATYAIYAKKDLEKFIQLKNEYFSLLEDMVTSQEYERAAIEVFESMQGQLSKPACVKCIDWLTAAKSFKISEAQTMRYLCMLADCYMGLENKTKAKECYNEAYVYAMQIGDKRMMSMIQASLQKME